MRYAEISRDTKETKITVKVNLDGSGIAKFNTSIPFFEHMLDQIAKHAAIDLEINCVGDNHIDDHHSVEDIGIAFGQAITLALGNKQGITRFAHSYVALDEALSRVVIDISGRPGLHFFAEFTSTTIGRFDTQLVREFFQAFVNHSLITLHIDNLRGINAHHQVESIFKAFAKALANAIAINSKNPLELPSTKGKL